MVMSHHITNHAGLGALVMHPGELLADGPTMTLNWILSWADDLLLTDNPSLLLILCWAGAKSRFVVVVMR